MLFSFIFIFISIFLYQYSLSIHWNFLSCSIDALESKYDGVGSLSNCCACQCCAAPCRFPAIPWATSSLSWGCWYFHQLGADDWKMICWAFWWARRTSSAILYTLVDERYFLISQPFHTDGNDIVVSCGYFHTWQCHLIRFSCSVRQGAATECDCTNSPSALFSFPESQGLGHPNPLLAMSQVMPLPWSRMTCGVWPTRNCPEITNIWSNVTSEYYSKRKRASLGTIWPMRQRQLQDLQTVWPRWLRPS